MKILVAEDDTGILESYIELLSNQGHEVIPTKDGLECLSVYRKEMSSTYENHNNKTPFDVIIIDFSMPFVNGADVVKTIHDICPSQRIIFATAHADDLIKEIISSKIEIEILQKPFSYSDLKNLLEHKTLQKIN